MLPACARSKFSAASRARPGIEGCRAWPARHCSQILNVACSSQLSTLIAGFCGTCLIWTICFRRFFSVPRADRGALACAGGAAGFSSGLPVWGVVSATGVADGLGAVGMERFGKRGMVGRRDVGGRPGMLAGRDKRRSERARSAVVVGEVRRTRRAAQVRVLRRRSLRPIAGERAACALARGWAARCIAPGGEIDGERVHATVGVDSA